MSTAQKVRAGAWSLSATVTVVAVLAWGQSLDWNIWGTSTYNLFPLFGLLAFSVMWSHYIAGVVRRYFGVEKASLKSYFEATSLIVLAFILLHPGLLIWQLWRDGLGLPPGSYLENYVAPTLKWAALLGSLSLFIFLAYEFHRLYGKKPWWKFIQYSSDVAMVMIFIHALKLGRQLGTGWFLVVWWVYGISLVGALVYTYIYNATKKRGE